MFTGIISDQGEIVAIDEGARSRRMTIRTPFDLSRTSIGASICCDGCCLTVVEKTAHEFVVDVAAETLSVTSLGGWQVGMRINLEPSLKMGDELGGHLVSGHIDGLATLKSVTRDGESWRLKIAVPPKLAPFIAAKGSVALNGISLTVNEVEGDAFGVCIIPHTWQVTNVAALRAGDAINLEVDMLARYVARILGASAPTSAAA